MEKTTCKECGLPGATRGMYLVDGVHVCAYCIEAALPRQMREDTDLWAKDKENVFPGLDETWDKDEEDLMDEDIREDRANQTQELFKKFGIY